MLDPPDAQLGLTRHRSFLAGAGSTLVESTADNAGANLWIMLGNSNEWKIYGFWVDQFDLFLWLCDQGSGLFPTSYQGLKRLNPIVYIYSRPYESLQPAQVDLLLQENMPGQQIKKVPSQNSSRVKSSFSFFVVMLATFLDSFDISWTWILDDFGQSSMPKGLKWSFLGNTGPKVGFPRFFWLWTLPVGFPKR